jgi:hypothetical protein
MTGRIKLGEKYFGPKILVGELISSNVRIFHVQQYKMGLQTYTFILKDFQCAKKIIYIQNLGNDFFSNENVYNINYIKNLKVECVIDFNKEYKKIRLCSRTLKSKYITN